MVTAPCHCERGEGDYLHLLLTLLALRSLQSSSEPPYDTCLPSSVYRIVVVLSACPDFVTCYKHGFDQY